MAIKNTEEVYQFLIYINKFEVGITRSTPGHYAKILQQTIFIILLAVVPVQLSTSTSTKLDMVLKAKMKETTNFVWQSFEAP